MTPNPGATEALIRDVLLPALWLLTAACAAYVLWPFVPRAVRAVVRAIQSSRGLTGRALIRSKGEQR